MEAVTTHRKSWSYRLAFRISVRGLIVLVLFVGGGLGWIVHRSKAQRDAVAAIEKAGGRVEYDFQWVDDTTDPPTPPSKPWPKWLVNAVGIDFLSTVVSVELLGFAAPDHRMNDDTMRKVGRLDHLKSLDLVCEKVIGDGLVHLRGLTHLRSLSLYSWSESVKVPKLPNLTRMSALRNLYLSGFPVTDSDLSALSNLRGLERLYLDDTKVTDDGLVHLRGLDLRELSLERTAVTDGGLVHLRGLDLRELSLADTSVTAQGLAQIRGIHRLETLNLNRTRVDNLESLRGLKNLRVLFLHGTPMIDAGLIPVQNLTRLTHLGLSRTEITDTGLAYLAKLTNLETLDLGNTRITDAGLTHLAGLSRCSELEVNRTAVTAAGAASLMKATPGINVIR